MRAYSISELFRMTRDELFRLYDRIASELPVLTGTDREQAVETMRRIRQVLAHPQYRPPY